MGRHRFGVAILIAALSIPAAGMAADPAESVLAAAKPEWTVTLGAEGRVEPAFRGSDRSLVLPFPLFDIRRAGTPEQFHGPRDGIGISLYETGNFQFGPVGQIRRARREADDAALRGLGNVAWAGELGAFAEYSWFPWLRARGELRQGIGGHHGIVSDLMLDAVVPVTAQLTLSGGPRVTLASTGANAPYFTIDPAQALASGLPPFDARGGVQSVGVGTQARYRWNPEWATHAFVEVERLVADAANSPLVAQRGSPNQVTFGLGVTRSFNMRQFW